jgi:hypothetical protein
MRRIPVCLSLIVTGTSGCLVGPGSIAMNRSVYREVINRTEDEQLLNLVVRDRYKGTYGMLAVASVTASLRASATLAGQFGLSRSLAEDYAGNLVPLAGGVAYEENPTISYVPIGGERFVQRLLNPLSTEELLLMGQFLATGLDGYMRIAMRSINGIRNPHVYEGGSESSTFDRVVEHWAHLARVGGLRVARDAEGKYHAMFNVDQEDDRKRLEELLELTGIKARPTDGRLMVPVRAAAEGRSDDSFNMESRSVMEILRTAGACIEIPEAHLKAGVVEARDADQDIKFMRIHSARLRPKGAGTIAMRYRDWWYYIDDTDPASKQAFQFLRTLVGLRLSDRSKETEAPVLTIPVR